jgi:hypothetical protein
MNRLLLALCIACAAVLSGGCKHGQQSGDPAVYPWHGPLTDGTNGIVQPPRW